MKGNGEPRSGAVLVVGGGIAGMQAALDCANSGFKVYLLERGPAIGGNMARLDKTFPTNDCAMCMLSPKLVEAGRHLNIEIISYADLKQVSGQAGDFSVTINKRARFVDEEKCNGCGDCEAACPVEIKDEFNGELKERKAIYRLYPQAIPNVFTIDRVGKEPPCRATCPAGVNAQGYIALIARGKFLEALDVVRERMPFAGICGRVCHHPCEAACNRAQIDEAVSIRNLKRFAADYERGRRLRGESIERPASAAPPGVKQEYGERVAVIGGGPAGLTCADDLVRRGYRATVFEARAELGGMLRSGIPAYRLPRDILNHEINLILRRGVEARTEQALGRDFTIDSLRADGFASIFLSTGAPLAKKIPLPGSKLSGVYYGLDFLDAANRGTPPPLGARVAVIGGGNVALDVARTARRFAPAARIALYCLESRGEMPAHAWEIAEAEEEGVDLNPGWGPERVEGEDGRARTLELARCVKVFDAAGRFNPLFDRGKRRAEAVDTVLLAVGQGCDPSFLDGRIRSRGGMVEADPLTLETSMAGVFAGGDNVLGPASLVQAVAQGHRAAESIHRHLRGEGMRAEREPVFPTKDFADVPAWVDLTRRERRPMPMTDWATRRISFAEIENGYSEEEAVAEARRCLQCGGCSVCRECVRVCKAQAIDHNMRDVEGQLKVGAIILSGGYEPFDARRKGEYGFGRYPNVVTSMQFERILSASGPYSGHVKRPSDGRTPRRIAWIQCVGSRDASIGNDFCSSVCCTYATKEAIIAKEHEPGVEATIFHIDMRAFGKGFEAYYNRAREQYGVRYIRSQISSVKEDPTTRELILRYVGEGSGIVEERFDMVVLSVGLTANRSMKDLAGIAGIKTNRYGFARGDAYVPLETDRAGIFLCGAAGGPRDIPETVMEASAAAARCGELLRATRGSEVKIKEYPVERDVRDEKPRIGVFVCHCGSNIASVVDVAKVADDIGRLPGVVHTEHTIYACAQDTQEKMKSIIKEKGLNRLIVASCTPRTHEPLFQETLREAGLNKYLFEMADIREQCAWCHKGDPDSATEKAKALVRGSVGKSRLLEALQFKRVAITKSALVLGGGAAGMTAALSLANQGFPVYLVEKGKELGGNMRLLSGGLEGQDWPAWLTQTMEDARAHPLIETFLGCEIDQTSGCVGNFMTRLRGASDQMLRHGVIIVATGARESRPEGFLFDDCERVLTQRGLETKLAGGFAPDTIVMIQCVGSRDAQRPYCSRLCCGQAIKNALAIKERNPHAKVTILYRDIRTYQYREESYQRARRLGVTFIHFPDDSYPRVARKGAGLKVTVFDTVLGRELELAANWVALSAAIEPDQANNRQLADLLKVPVNEDGFFMEAHVKLRPVDFANEGIFVCGLAHSPKYAEENLTQALAAAGRAATVLAKDSLEVGGVVSVVDADKCATCLTCVRECVYQAPFINAEGKAEIEAAKCQGCGNCASACPARAIQLRAFTDAEETALFRSILREPETTGVGS